jgi:hypothetical protein
MILTDFPRPNSKADRVGFARPDPWLSTFMRVLKRPLTRRGKYTINPYIKFLSTVTEHGITKRFGESAK